MKNFNRRYINDLIIIIIIIHVISAYAPQEGKSQEEKEEFWGMMDDSIGNIPENEILMIGGDLNGHVGEDRNSFEDVMGIDG